MPRSMDKEFLDTIKIIGVFLLIILVIYWCFKCANTRPESNRRPSLDPYHIRPRPGVFVVPGMNGTSPLGPIAEVNRDLDYYGSDGYGNLLVTTQDLQQLYVVNQADNQRTVIVPVMRNPSPPPSYNSLYNL